MADYTTDQVLDLIRHDKTLARSDLRHLDLSKARLAGGDMRRADLEGANLEGANLHKAKLSSANLRDSYLGHANLEGANLQKADLEGANLEGANLEGANLGRANLEGANLEGANLDGARLTSVQLEQANLGGASAIGAVTSRIGSLAKTAFPSATASTDPVNRKPLSQSRKASENSGYVVTKVEYPSRSTLTSTIKRVQRSMRRLYQGRSSLSRRSTSWAAFLGFARQPH